MRISDWSSDVCSSDLEVARFSADPDVEPVAEPTPEEAAADMHVWHDDAHGEWRTNFPPPEDFTGIEEGEFGDEDYERTLEIDEEEAWLAAREAEVAPLRAAGEAARRAFFAIPAPANEIGRAHVRTPVTNAQHLCRHLHEKTTH